MNLHRLAAAILTLIGTVGPCWAQPALVARLYASGFASPVAFVQDPTQRAIQYVVEQGGRIRVVQNGTVLPSDFLNLSAAISSGGERGLLGLAFAPDYGTSGRFYVNFTNPAGHTVVARFVRSANVLVADPLSRFDLRWGGSTAPRFIAQPFANHNGGNLAFGPDGFLYIGLGDGGSGNDPDHRAQNPAELLGKMLRIDVNVAASDPAGYRIPPDNPFVAAAGTRPEIWSFGLRNPWRYSFDDPSRGGTGALVIGDVGQNAWEEVDYEPPNRGGRNYGWRNREGLHPNIASRAPAYTPLTDPIHEYAHPGGISITGGYVYRGSALGPAYRGRYFFADLSGHIWSMGMTIDGMGEAHKTDVIEHTASLGGTGVLGNVTAFGVGWDGELFVLNYANGTVLKIVPSQSPPARSADFNGDGLADVAVFRPSTGTWHVADASVVRWGGNGDVPLPGDFDADGKNDIALFRPSSGAWYIIGSRTGLGSLFTFGGNGDVPVPADYNGDGTTDIAVFRPSTGMWYLSTGVAYRFGGAGDIPVPGDYDGDGRSDVAVFRQSTGAWHLGTGVTLTFGGVGDVPVPGDYDGDGKTDVGVFRPSTGTWYIARSSTLTVTQLTLGGLGDIPVPGDYDGDGRTDIALFRQSTGQWFIVRSSTMTGVSTVWGGNGDLPVLQSP